MTSFIAIIVKELTSFVDKMKMPDDRHNVGRLLAQAYVWDAIEAHAKKQSDQLWNTLEAQGHILSKDKLQPGEHTLCDSPHFVCTARVTAPINRFSPEELASRLNKSKYKVPTMIALEMIDQSKVPGKSAVTYKISEQNGVNPSSRTK